MSYHYFHTIHVCEKNCLALWAQKWEILRVVSGVCSERNFISEHSMQFSVTDLHPQFKATMICSGM